MLGWTVPAAAAVAAPAKITRPASKGIMTVILMPNKLFTDDTSTGLGTVLVRPFAHCSLTLRAEHSVVFLLERARVSWSIVMGIGHYGDDRMRYKWGRNQCLTCPRKSKPDQHEQEPQTPHPPGVTPV